MEQNTQTPRKGEWGEECNRAECNNQNAVYYNHSTRMHYCKHCASTINRLNRTDALQMYGHDLCLEVKEKEHLQNLVIEIAEEEMPFVDPFLDNALMLENTYMPPKIKANRDRTVAVRTEPKIGRNQMCPCGSGKKYKKCCINGSQEDKA